MTLNMWEQDRCPQDHCKSPVVTDSWASAVTSKFADGMFSRGIYVVWQWEGAPSVTHWRPKLLLVARALTKALGLPWL